MIYIFSIGDKIFYPMHGAGIIEAIEEREAFGAKATYYCLKMPIGDISLYIPAETAKSNGLRRVMTSEDAFEVLKSIPDLQIDMSDNWNRRHRDNMDLLKTGDIIEVSRVVKGLLLREREKNLSTGERKMLISAKNILLSEIVLATGLSKVEAEELIEEKISLEV